MVRTSIAAISAPAEARKARNMVDPGNLLRFRKRLYTAKAALLLARIADSERAMMNLYGQLWAELEDGINLGITYLNPSEQKR